jgi:hypothetical protein
MLWNVLIALSISPSIEIAQYQKTAQNPHYLFPRISKRLNTFLAISPSIVCRQCMPKLKHALLSSSLSASKLEMM